MMNDLFAEDSGKRCSMCGRFRPLSFFSASRRSADGLQYYCKDCQRRYRQRHPTREYKYKTDRGTLFSDEW